VELPRLVVSEPEKDLSKGCDYRGGCGKSWDIYDDCGKGAGAAH